MLTLSNISKSFNGVPALDAVDLEVERNATTILIGPSGCGKSTLLRIMIGLVYPEQGSVTIGDMRLTAASAPALRRRMGYVIQDGGLFPNLTSRKNITLMASYLGWDRNRIAARLEALTALTQFPSDGLERYPAELSGGQQQRVSLMRALMLDPEILLLDEPLGALDPMIRYDLQAQLKSIFTKLGKTVVMVTHDLGEAAFFGDTIVLMRTGRIVQRGVFDSLIQSPSEDFVSRFVKAQRQAW